MPQRMLKIVDDGVSGRVSRTRAAHVIVACVAICAVLVAVTSPTRAQFDHAAALQAPGNGSLPTFEVASVKPTPADDLEMGTFLTYAGGRIEARGCTLTYLVMVAYDVQKFQISGADGWIDHDRFSIDAKPPAGSASTKINPSNPKLLPPNEERLMLRALLADRFQLVLKQTTQDVSGFALVLKDPNPKLSAPKDGQAYPVVAMGHTFESESPWYLQGINASMTKFADRLSTMLLVPVVDRTGLTGSYDFLVKYADSRDENASGPLLKDAIQDIGLKLEATKVPMPHLEIVHAARPSEN